MKPLNFAFSESTARDQRRESVRFSLDDSREPISADELQNVLGFRPQNDENEQN